MIQGHAIAVLNMHEKLFKFIEKEIFDFLLHRNLYILYHVHFSFLNYLLKLLTSETIFFL